MLAPRRPEFARRQERAWSYESVFAIECQATGEADDRQAGATTQAGSGQRADQRRAGLEPAKAGVEVTGKPNRARWFGRKRAALRAVF